jgi:hypothetical protein
VFILDLEASSMTEVVHRLVEDLCVEGAIEVDQKADIMRVLLYKHKYVTDTGHLLGSKGSNKLEGIKRSISGKSLSVSDCLIINP